MRWAAAWSTMASLNDLICAGEQRRRDRQPQRLGRLEVDDELEVGGLLDRQVAGLGALEDLVDVAGRASLELESVRTIHHEAAGLDVLPQTIHRCQAA